MKITEHVEFLAGQRQACHIFVAKHQMEKSHERSSCNHYLPICVMVAIRWKCITKVKENNFIHTIQRRKANWIGHTVRRNCLLKHVI